MQQLECDRESKKLKVDVNVYGVYSFEESVLRLDAPEEEHAGDSVPAHAELSEHSERMFENI